MAPGKRPTIKDVAALAGVSKSTVSLVLQNSGLVKAQTREAIQAAMKELNYVRNRAAATLRGSDTGLIGLVLNDLRNPFFTEFAASVQMALYQRGFATVIANCDEDAAVQERTVQSMLEHDLSALIISPCYGAVGPAFEAIVRSGLPALQVLRTVEEGPHRLPFFTHDYVEGSRLAARHLLDQGLTRIAFIGGVEGRDITRDRMHGYLSELAARGLSPTILPGRPSRRFGREMAHELLDAHAGIEGAICFNDLVALGIQTGLAERGCRVGRDFCLIGFDDIEEAQLAHPPLTTIQCDVARFGRISAEMLLTQIETGEAPPSSRRHPVELVVRASTERHRPA